MSNANAMCNSIKNLTGHAGLPKNNLHILLLKLLQNDIWFENFLGKIGKVCAFMTDILEGIGTHYSSSEKL